MQKKKRFGIIGGVKTAIQMLMALVKDGEVMPIYTYLKDNEKTNCSDRDILELLDEINKYDENKWLVREREYTYTRWFRKKTLKRYSLLYTAKYPEVQIVNFAPKDPNDWSISVSESRADILNFLMGYLNGIERMKSAK
jgi:hypothetical protein